MTTPSLRLEFPPTPEEYRANIRRQKAIALLIVRKIRQRKSLQTWELAFIAAQLTARVSDMSDVMPKASHRPQLYNHSDIALAVARLMRYEGMKKTPAIARVAEMLGHEDTGTVRNAVKAKGAAAEAYVLPLGKK